jgi:hypothetical protein
VRLCGRSHKMLLDEVKMQRGMRGGEAIAAL